MKKTCFSAIVLALLLSLPTVGAVYAADSAPVLSYSSNAQGDQQTLRLDGIPSGCYGMELSISINGGKNCSFAFDKALTTGGNYSVETKKDGSITLYVAAGENPLTTASSLTLGTLSADKSFSIGSVSGKLLDGNMQVQNHTSVSVQKNASSSSSGGSSSSARYAVNIETIEGGFVEADPAKADRGDKVSLRAIPDDGFVLDSIRVTDKNKKEITLTEQSDSRFTFTMPASDVSVLPVFKEGQKPERPATSFSGSLPFRDVPEKEWFYSAVQYVYGNGIMSGTDPDLFSPNVTTTRGMIVTILYRLEGKPAATAAPFLDVSSSQYYAPAVAWASDNGIVSGYGEGLFGPEDTISREQMASILYRYARYKGYDVSASADLSGFTDIGTLSPYAAPAMRWANANGLVTGTTPTTLEPGGSAVRAQVASILMRFCENIAK